jgi:signal transduction histidine kinase
MKKILLVDDDEMLRLTFGAALRQKDYHVIEADSGKSGLEMARQHLPDLILSDIHMPGGNGSTLLEDIRRDPELRSRQVVLMTGKPELVTPRKGMEDGADDFLVKPVSFEGLLSCVEARFRRASINWRVEDEMLAQLRSSMPSQLPHEVFTPLAGIIGLLDVLRSDSSSLNTKEVEEIYADMHHSAFRLHRTLRNYLMLLESQNTSTPSLVGTLPSNRVEESIRMGVIEALRLNKRKEDVTVRVDACSMAVKPGDLSQIVEELVDNACKFSRQGTPVEVKLTADGELTVSDRGRGMTVEEVNRVGFFRQFEKKKLGQQGLGLGLVLVQRLVSLSKATFAIDSEPGDGTRVRVAFALVPK